MSESSAKLTIVIDTNLIVSGMIVRRGNPFALLEAWRTQAFTVLVSGEQHTELLDVFSRDKIVRDYHLTAAELTELFGLLDAAPHIQPSQTIPVQLRDSKDEHILTAALGGDADYVVTGDKDLLRGCQ